VSMSVGPCGHVYMERTCMYGAHGCVWKFVFVPLNVCKFLQTIHFNTSASFTSSYVGSGFFTACVVFLFILLYALCVKHMMSSVRELLRYKVIYGTLPLTDCAHTPALIVSMYVGERELVNLTH